MFLETSIIIIYLSAVCVDSDFLRRVSTGTVLLIRKALLFVAYYTER